MLRHYSPQNIKCAPDECSTAQWFSVRCSAGDVDFRSLDSKKSTTIQATRISGQANEGRRRWIYKTEAAGVATSFLASVDQSKMFSEWIQSVDFCTIKMRQRSIETLFPMTITYFRGTLQHQHQKSWCRPISSQVHTEHVLQGGLQLLAGASYMCTRRQFLLIVM